MTASPRRACSQRTRYAQARPLPDNGVPVPEYPVDHQSVQMSTQSKGNAGRTILAFLVIALLAGALGYGLWKHFTLHAEVMATAEARRDFVPMMRTAAVRASDQFRIASWPGTTEAFEQANIYARASGYISKRDVDIGSRVKAGDLFVEITAPEIEHQIAQAEGTLAQLRANLEQAKANRDLAQVTWDRDSKLLKQGWTTAQQGDTDRLTLQSREAAVRVAAADIVAQEAQLRVLNQQRVSRARGGAVRRRRRPAQHRRRQPSAGGRRQRHLSVRTGACGRHPHPALRAAGRRHRHDAGHAGGDAHAGNPGPRLLREHHPHRRRAAARHPHAPDRDGCPTRTTRCRRGCTAGWNSEFLRKTPSLIVPSEAMIFNRNGLSVRSVENDTARIRNAAVVRDFGTSVEVSEGVAAGDKVIMNPQVGLADGRKVTIPAGSAEARPDEEVVGTLFPMSSWPGFSRPCARHLRAIKG